MEFMDRVGKVGKYDKDLFRMIAERYITNKIASITNDSDIKEDPLSKPPSKEPHQGETVCEESIYEEFAHEDPVYEELTCEDPVRAYEDMGKLRSDFL